MLPCRAFRADFSGGDYSEPVLTHIGIAHTRWATHGIPCERNSHPHRSDEGNGFVVVHNGIITNYNDVKTFLAKRGYEFESDTDTEVFAKLVHHLWNTHPTYSFRELVEQAILQVVSGSRKVPVQPKIGTSRTGRRVCYCRKVQALPWRVRSFAPELTPASRN